MNNKILLAIQFYDGDKEQAMKVARLIADLETRHCGLADFLFVARFDSSIDLETVNYVARKFNTLHYVNKWRRGKEWPHGPNEQWFGTMEYVCSLTQAARVPPYKAVLTFEADAAPLCPNWISMMSRDWDAAKVKTYGALQSSPGPHVNGNALFSCDPAFLQWVAREVGGCRPSGGWDYVLAPEFKKRGWANAPGFRSWWQTRSMSEETFQQLLRENVYFFHGIKNDDLIRHVRARFLR